MKTKYILFDLDGTLLPMDQDEFTTKYMEALAKKMAGLGFEPKKLIDTIWSGVFGMLKNEGQKTNEEIFWDKFIEVYGEESTKYIPDFDEFYRNEFIAAKEGCYENKEVFKIINELKKKNVKLVLATNPIFPAVATERRIGWAGLNASDFEMITTYENSRYSKPNEKYYLEILDKIGAKSEECLMIGNDVSDDMSATKIGIEAFLITDCLINRDNQDYSKFNHGTFDDFVKFIKDKIK